MKRNAIIQDALGFDDVVLLPGETQVRPEDVNTFARLTKTITLNIPLLAAGHPAVTESALAIALAEQGGLGILHGAMPMGKQVEEVRRVKRAGGRIVSNPITVAPDAGLAEAADLMATYKISGLPVVDNPSQKVVGILTARDLRFFEDRAKLVADVMTKEVITVKANITPDAAGRLMHQHRIEKLVLLDAKGRCAGLITAKDLAKTALFPHACRDAQGRLRVGAAVGTGKDALDRAAAMADAGLDVLFIDVAHAHTREAAGTVSRIRQQRSSDVQIVAGNVATAEAAGALIDAGADGVKIGGKSADLAAALRVAEQCALMGMPATVSCPGAADGRRVACALAAGAETVILDQPFAGAEESPGRLIHRDGTAWKRHAGGEAVTDVYADTDDDGGTCVPYLGPARAIVAEVMRGLRHAMATTGGGTVRAFIDAAEFARRR